MTTPENNEENKEIVSVPKPGLPAPDELKLKKPRKIPLADLVLPIYAELYTTSERFRRLQLAVDNAGSVEGTIRDDDSEVATMIRDNAPEDSPVKVALKSEIRGAAGRVAGWYGINRSARKKEYRAALEATKSTETNETETSETETES